MCRKGAGGVALPLPAATTSCIAQGLGLQSRCKWCPSAVDTSLGPRSRPQLAILRGSAPLPPQWESITAASPIGTAAGAGPHAKRALEPLPVELCVCAVVQCRSWLQASQGPLLPVEVSSCYSKWHSPRHKTCKTSSWKQHVAEMAAPGGPLAPTVCASFLVHASRYSYVHDRFHSVHTSCTYHPRQVHPAPN